MSSHVAYVTAEATRKVGAKPVIEPTFEAQEQWAMQIMAGAPTFAAMRGCTPGYLSMEGEIDKLSQLPMEAQMKAARRGIWGGGIASFIQILEGWRAQGDLEGLDVTAA